MLPNDVAAQSAVVNLTSADVTLDTAGRDCSFKTLIPHVLPEGIVSRKLYLGLNLHFILKSYKTLVKFPNTNFYIQ